MDVKCLLPNELAGASPPPPPSPRDRSLSLVSTWIPIPSCQMGFEGANSRGASPEDTRSTSQRGRRGEEQRSSGGREAVNRLFSPRWNFIATWFTAGGVIGDELVPLFLPWDDERRTDKPSAAQRRGQVLAPFSSSLDPINLHLSESIHQIRHAAADIFHTNVSTGGLLFRVDLFHGVFVWVSCQEEEEEVKKKKKRERKEFSLRRVLG